MSKVKELNRCLCCNSTNLELVFDLGKQPLANSFKASSNEKENVYPLAVQVCRDCWHMQLTDAVDPTKIGRAHV